MLHCTNVTVLPATEAERDATARLQEDHVRNLENQITELAAHLDAATFLWLGLARELDESGGWFGDGLKSCVHWLNWRHCNCAGLALLLEYPLFAHYVRYSHAEADSTDPH